MKKRTQQGIAHLGLLLLVLVVAAIALIGYKVWNNRNNTSTPVTASTVQSTGQAIKSTADLNQAENSLNSQNIDGDLNPDSLNQDVQSLL